MVFLEERPTINGLNAVAFNVGTGIILWKMKTFNTITGNWQHTLIIFSLVSIIFTIVWLLVEMPEKTNTENKKEPCSQNKAQQSSDNYTYLDGLKDKLNWIYALGYSGLLAFYICLFTFYPKAGISQSTWVIGFGIIGTLAGIIYSKKFPLRIPIIRWSGLLVILTVVGLSFGDDLWLQTLCAMTLGFFIFFPVTALVSIPHELPNMTSKKITVIFSLFYSISYSVGTLVLWGFGKLVDLNQGDFSQAFILISVISTSFFIGSFFLPETGKLSSE